MNRDQREAFVATLIRLIGIGPLKEGVFSFLYNGENYPISELKEGGMVYHQNRWTLRTDDTRYFVAGADLKRTLKGVRCVFHMGGTHENG